MEHIRLEISALGLGETNIYRGGEIGRHYIQIATSCNQ